VQLHPHAPQHPLSPLPILYWGVFPSDEPGPVAPRSEDRIAKKQPSLPANRTFVVQLHAEAQIEQGEFRGRVEHVVSYQAAHFASVEELTAFMVRVLTANPQATATTGTEGDSA